jgi:hypothetical protein
MKKMAIFVEGGTELAFTEKLLLEIAGAKNIQVHKEKDRGGGKVGRYITFIGKVGAQQDHHHYVLLVDCGGDDRVRSVIKDRYKSLCDERYRVIVGLRDIRGEREGRRMTYADIPNMLKWMDYGVPMQPIRPTMVLAVMEIEAWFLAEHSHFSRVDSRLTLPQVTQILGFDPSTGAVEERPEPSNDLDTVYRTVGKAYEKVPASTQATIDALDYNVVYLGLKSRTPNIFPLIDAINEFLN